MSLSLTFRDTHAAIKNLEAKGASKDLAEEIVATMQAAHLASDPATQKNISDLRAEMYRAFVIHGFTTVTAVIGSAIALAAFLS
ncbi:hypothetical protein RZ517_14970 [Roseovarius sp. S88]|uniref:DUF1640 domain-containing protein n=1 Tax=Roseovarius phycicola TaxID=3080976 RepID=A0ABZ2HDV0_9RHOB